MSSVATSSGRHGVFADAARIDGYARIRDYAVIGDGRTAALVAMDGAVDWLCLPNFDSPSICAAVLDADHGGSFVLQPAIVFSVTRRYLPDTNVLETTFHTESGQARVVDALTIPDRRLTPLRELARSIEGVEGQVPMQWHFTPRFRYGSHAPRCEWRGTIPVATCRGDAVAICSWEAGAAAWANGAIGAAFTTSEGSRSLLALVAAYEEPLVFPSRAAVEARLQETLAFWRQWTAALHVEGPWRDAVTRSALALKLMIFAPTGAAIAAPTTSLPEDIGGIRNWDYRFCWIRDSAFTIDALLQLGCRAEAQALFWWFMQATALTEPRLQVLYRMDGSPRAPERELPLAGYRGSTPVRIGNAAVEQEQLDIYGDFMETAWLYAKGEHGLDPDTGARLGRIADLVCDRWREPDAGIWEVRGENEHFTHSKVMCWVALNRAVRLALEGDMPKRHVDRWKREADAIVAFVNTRCWSDRLGSYVRAAGTEQLDASLLMLPIMGFGDCRGSRINGTIDAVSRDLRQGPFVFRYRTPDGLPGDEGLFVNCSFWLVGALARAGRVAEATSLMTELIACANDVGLYAEEIDGRTREFLGNFPQALVHLSLIDAALALAAAAGEQPGPGKGARTPP